MASCIHGYLPVGRAAAAIQEMARIRILMQESHVGEPMSVEFKNEVLSSISKAISALDYGETSEPGRIPVGSRGTSKFSDDRKRGISSGSRRGGWRKRSPSSSSRKVLTITPEDGLAWRKYGEKEIQNSTYPRSYFRCTHKYDQGCMATRQVQQSKEDPSKFVIIYKGEHTCSGDQSTIPQIIETTSSPKDSHLISFGSNTIPLPPPRPPVHSKQETQLVSSSNSQLVSSSNSAKHDCCNEDDVVSNPTPGGSSAEFFAASFESSFGNLDMGFTASSLFDFEHEDFSLL